MMKKILFSITVIVLMCFLGFNTFSQGYKISVKINGIKDTTLLLGHHFADKKFVKDTIRVDENGFGIFEGKEKLDGGIYLIILPWMTYFEILMPEDQVFYIETDTADYVKNMKITGSVQNQKFNDYQAFMGKKQTQMSELNKKLEASKENEAEVKRLREEMKKMDKEVKDNWKRISAENKGTLFGNVINAMRSPEIPEFEIPEFYENKDSVKQMWQYLYNKNHYFDHIDFSDDRLLRTPLFESKMGHFFKKIIIQAPDTLIRETKEFIDKTRVNDEMFKYAVNYLLVHYSSSKIMGMDEVLVFVGESYYLSGEAFWADSTHLAKIRERVEKISPNIIGKIASDMKLITYDNKVVTLHGIDTKYTIIAFWEPGCGHCKKLIPKLHEVYSRLFDANKSVEVIAIFTQVKEKDEWVEFIEKNAITDWINAYDPYGWSNFRNNYDIYSTPVIYLLDKSKKIIAKRIDVEKIEEFIENYEKYNK
ncbi:MAG: DUF5106 domain-containing protein [Bacteroidetes bacterium]|jgi:thiol-disulfide isomerase/thioredoxin|nr:DUF5106 domain-containing protein [Bacteroidota bacterium]MBT7492640.1 DUF5106 domain-containing protein [Bacteroidota bacterium]